MEVGQWYQRIESQYLKLKQAEIDKFLEQIKPQTLHRLAVLAVSPWGSCWVVGERKMVRTLKQVGGVSERGVKEGRKGVR